MDGQLGSTLRVGDQVLYRNVIHTVVTVSEEGPYLDGVYAPTSAVAYTELYLPVLLNPPPTEGKAWPTLS